MTDSQATPPADAPPEPAAALPDVYSISTDGEGVVTGRVRSNCAQDGMTVVGADVWQQIQAIGGPCKFDGHTVTSYTPPPPPPTVPASVSNYQARAVLIAQGLFDKVDATLRGADQSVATNKLALSAWDYANDFYRRSPFVASFGPALGLTDAQIDALFVAAAAVQ